MIRGRGGAEGLEALNATAGRYSPTGFSAPKAAENQWIQTSRATPALTPNSPVTTPAPLTQHVGIQR